MPDNQSSTTTVIQHKRPVWEFKGLLAHISAVSWMGLKNPCAMHTIWADSEEKAREMLILSTWWDQTPLFGVRLSFCHRSANTGHSGLLLVARQHAEACNTLWHWYLDPNWTPEKSSSSSSSSSSSLLSWGKSDRAKKRREKGLVQPQCVNESRQIDWMKTQRLQNRCNFTSYKVPYLFKCIGISQKWMFTCSFSLLLHVDYQLNKLSTFL